MKSLKERAIREEMEVPVPIPNADGSGVAETIVVRVTALRDPVTGEVFLDDEALEAIDKAKSRHLGLLSPEEIKALRDRLQLTQGQMSDLLQIGEKTYTRWESGRSRPSRAMNLLLLGLLEGVIPTGWLKSVLKKHFEWNMTLPTPAQVRAEWLTYDQYEMQGMGTSPPETANCRAPPPINVNVDCNEGKSDKNIEHQQAMKSSNLQVNVYFVTALNFTANKQFDPEKPINLQFEDLEASTSFLKHTELPRSWQVTLRIKHQPARTDAHTPYYFTIEIVGHFTVSDEYAPDKVEWLVKTNAPSVLFSTAREVIRGISAAGPFGPMILPTASFYDSNPQENPQAAPPELPAKNAQ